MSSIDPRPLSPHLQIYKLPFTAMLSVVHRGTGVVLSFGLLLVVMVLLALSSGGGAWETAQAMLENWFIKLVLFGFTFALYFHACTGMRHLFWDIGKGFSLEESLRSGKLVLIVSTGLTLLTWIIAIAARTGGAS